MISIRTIREADHGALLACFTELQRYEHTIESNREDADRVAEQYMARLLARSRDGEVEILAAEVGDSVVGFIGVVARHRSDDLLERYRDFAYITDLIVLEPYRGRGIGRMLLEAAAAHAIGMGARRMRVGVLAANEQAHRVYRAAGFRPYEVILEKAIDK